MTRISSFLLFTVLCGMSGSVSTDLLRNALRKPAGIAIGLSCQFILLPFLGCLSATVFGLDVVLGIALITTTSSPGGAYSNWWCSVLNADLALSVMMTACSTLASVVMLPVNLLAYTYFTYGKVPSFRWVQLLWSIGVALSGLACGMLLVACRPHWSNCLNATGNIAGVLLILLGLLGSIKSEETVPGAIQAWSDVSSLVAVATPCACSILLSFSVAFLCRTLTKQEAIAVTVEVVYQNTGLATSILLATFGSERRAIALSVPMVYALIQTVGVPSILVLAWKMGYTYAPPTAPMLSVVCKNWQPGSEDVRTTMNPEVELIHDDDCEAATRKLAALESLPELP